VRIVAQLLLGIAGAKWRVRGGSIAGCRRRHAMVHSHGVRL